MEKAKNQKDKKTGWMQFKGKFNMDTFWARRGKKMNQKRLRMKTLFQKSFQKRWG